MGVDVYPAHPGGPWPENLQAREAAAALVKYRKELRRAMDVGQGTLALVKGRWLHQEARRKAERLKLPPPYPGRGAPDQYVVLYEGFVHRGPGRLFVEAGSYRGEVRIEPRPGMEVHALCLPRLHAGTREVRVRWAPAIEDGTILGERRR